MLRETLLNRLPAPVRNQLDALGELLDVSARIRDPRVLRSLGPSGLRGLLLHRGKQGVPTHTKAGHLTHFDWRYPHDHEEMAQLYVRAKDNQWRSDELPWHIAVDPLNPEVPLLPDDFLDFARIERRVRRLSRPEKQALLADVATWMLSQFLHGEQGALFAAAQVTEAVQFFDGKLYGATQVMDEARHVEVFLRYLETKLNKLYQVNDNLFVIIDALMADSRWDMKFLGMQILVEGLALGAFGTLYQFSQEPLLRELLRYVILDESRHVHYGVLALREHILRELSEAERQEREDWAFQVCLLMRNRFMAYELYEESFEGLMSRAEWRQLVQESPGMERFRATMFSRLVPNLRAIGLMSARIQPAYADAGLMRYFNGQSADVLDGESLIAQLDRAA